MDISLDALNARLAAFAGAVADRPFGPQPLVYKVGGKTFAMVGETEPIARVTLKCEPVLAEALRQAYPAVIPGYHTNKRHWNTVRLDGDIPAEVFWNMVDASYDLVRASLPRTARAALAAKEA